MNTPGISILETFHDSFHFQRPTTTTNIASGLFSILLCLLLIFPLVWSVSAQETPSNPTEYSGSVFKTGQQQLTLNTGIAIGGNDVGRRAAPALELSGASANFGAVIVGESREMALITVKNTGDESADITAVTSSAAEFTVTTTSFPQTVAANSSITFTVRFNPESAAEFSATLTFATTDPANPDLQFSVAGSGINPNSGTITPSQFILRGTSGIGGLNGARNAAVSPDGKHVYVTAGIEYAVVVFDRNPANGELTHKETVEDGENGADGIAEAYGIALSPDGRFVYVTGKYENAVAVYSRDETTGTITFVEKKQDSVDSVDGLLGAQDIAISPDGAHVYVTAANENKVSVFSRNVTNGTLTYVEALTNGVNSVDGLGGVQNIIVSPDGAHVYVTGNTDNAVAAFSRNISTGALTFVEVEKDGVSGVDGIGGAQDVAISPDGVYVYVTGSNDDAVAVFSRNTSTGALTFIEFIQRIIGVNEGLDEVSGIVVSPGGRYVYLSSPADDAIAVYKRNTATGNLSYHDVEKDGISGVDGLNGIYGIAVSPDGKNVYTAAFYDDAIDMFQVDPGLGPHLRMFMSSYDFGAVGIGDTVAAAVAAVKNSGDARASVTGISTPGGAFFSTTTFPQIVPPGSTKTVSISFSPTAADSYSSAFTLSTDDTEHSTLEFTASGTGTLPVGEHDMRLIETEKDGVSGVDGLGGAADVIVSRDGAHVYTAGSSDNAVTLFTRDASTGALTYSTVYTDGTSGVDGLAGASALALSPDGAHLYVAGETENKIAAFNRNSTTGTLTFIAAYEDGVSGVDGLAGARDIVLSPDGVHVYVAGGTDDAVAVFAKNDSTGALTFVEAVKDSDTGIDGLDGAEAISVSLDGRHVYTAASADNAITFFTRNGTTGTLTFVQTWKDNISGLQLDGAGCIEVSPDGKHIYVACRNDDHVVVLKRYEDSGTIEYIEMIRDIEAGIDGLDGAARIALSPDGQYVYVSGSIDSALAVFSRNDTTGELTLLETIKENVDDFDGLEGAAGVAVSYDANHVYVTGSTDNALTGIWLYQYEPANMRLFNSSAYFGSIYEGDSLEIDLVTIMNTGELSASVTGVSSSIPEFSVITSAFPQTIPGDSIRSYDVRFVPSGIGTFTGTLTFATTDTNHAALEFSVTGICMEPNAGTLEYVESLKDDTGGIDGLSGASYTAVSPDGAHVYAAGAAENAVSAFARNGSTGKLTFIEAVKDGVGGVDGLNSPSGIAFSPSGASVYVTGYLDNAVAVFSRSITTGALTFVEVHIDGAGGVNGLAGAERAAVSPDGRHVYVTGSDDNAVALFRRDPDTGALTFVETLIDEVGLVDGLKGARGIAISNDGTHVYIASSGENTVAAFSRNDSTGTLTFIEIEKEGSTVIGGMYGTRDIVISPDGLHLYVCSRYDDAVTVFRRDPSNGNISLVEIVKDQTANTYGLEGAESITMSTNGAYVYTAATTNNSVSVFSRNASTGKLTFLEYLQDGTDGVDGLQGTSCVRVSPDGAHVYAAAQGENALTLFSVDLQSPVISIAPVTLSYDSVAIGTSDTLMVAVKNLSGGPLDIDSVRAPDEFAIVPASASGIARGDSLIFSVIFSPAADSLYTDSILFYSNDTASPVDTVAVTGRGFLLLEIEAAPDVDIITNVPTDSSAITFNFTNNSSLLVNFTSGNAGDGALTVRQVSDLAAYRPDIQAFSNALLYYDISVDIDTFAAELTFGYSDSLLTALGVEEDSLAVSFYDSTDTRGYIWHVVASAIDKASNTITAATNHFSMWALTSKDEDMITAVEGEGPVTPRDFALHQNYPNPFNPSTTIGFDLTKAAVVTVRIYSVTGQLVSTLTPGQLGPGTHTVIWDGRNAAGLPVGSGMYLYVLRAGDFTAVRKMLLVR